MSSTKKQPHLPTPISLHHIYLDPTSSTSYNYITVAVTNIFPLSLHIDKGFPARKLKEVNFYVHPSFFHFSSSNSCRPTFSCVRNISLTKTSCRLDCYLI